MGILRSLTRILKGPQCHLTDLEQDWMTTQWRWLHAQFGDQPVMNSPLMPRSRILPREWSGTQPEGDTLLRLLCPIMGVDFSMISTWWHTDQMDGGTYQGSAGLYISGGASGRHIISLHESGLQDPQGLVATILHELAHVRLLGEGRKDRTEQDHEPLTDLTSIYFGGGIFTANTVCRFDGWTDGQMAGWQARQLGYLTEAQAGFALALYATHRKESRPIWARFLRRNVLWYFDESMYFLRHRKVVVP